MKLAGCNFENFSTQFEAKLGGGSFYIHMKVAYKTAMRIPLQDNVRNCVFPLDNRISLQHSKKESVYSMTFSVEQFRYRQLWAEDSQKNHLSRIFSASYS